MLVLVRRLLMVVYSLLRRISQPRHDLIRPLMGGNTLLFGLNSDYMDGEVDCVGV